MSLLFLTSCIDSSGIKKVMEKAYFEGQRDAMKGDWKIKKTDDSCYVWVKSPWRVESEPIYSPVCE